MVTAADVQVITLTTDFGTQDWFVGVMKGVIAGIAPEAKVIDITHEIPPGNIRAGAFAVAASFSFFPKGTIHVAVIDPGVGSTRAPLAVRTEDYIFVGPDNGLLSWAWQRQKLHRIYTLENSKFFLKPVSQTFHGRDIFAPVAAHLSTGKPIQTFGRKPAHIVRLPWPAPTLSNQQITGQILYFDRFGNALTNISESALRKFDTSKLQLFSKRRHLCAVKEFYQAVPRGKPVGVLGSSGFLEIAINGGNAARQLKLDLDQPILVKTK